LYLCIRKGLQRVAEKLFFLGLIELIRPVVLLYPAWLLISEAVLITKQVQTAEKLEAKSVMQVIKALLVLAATLLQLRIVSLLPGIGYSCLVLGVVCFFISQSDSLLKPLTPLLAENLHKIDQGIDVFTQVQSTFLQRVSSLLDADNVTGVAVPVSVELGVEGEGKGAAAERGRQDREGSGLSAGVKDTGAGPGGAEEEGEEEEEDVGDTLWEEIVQSDAGCDDRVEGVSGLLSTTTGLRKRK
jgi:hypothetical protein